MYVKPITPDVSGPLAPVTVCGPGQTVNASTKGNPGADTPAHPTVTPAAAESEPPCPIGIRAEDLQRRIGVPDCALKQACIHLGLHCHGTQCPHLAFLDTEDKLHD